MLERRVRRARARCTTRATSTASTRCSTCPTAPPSRSCSPRSPRRCCASRAAAPTGTITWMTDERSVAEHVVPHLAGRRDRGGTRGAPDRRRAAGRACATTPSRGPRARREVFSVYEAIPTYQRILATGDADRPRRRARSSGPRTRCTARLESFRDAGRHRPRRHRVRGRRRRRRAPSVPAPHPRRSSRSVGAGAVATRADRTAARRDDVRPATGHDRRLARNSARVSPGTRERAVGHADLGHRVDAVDHRPGVDRGLREHVEARRHEDHVEVGLPAHVRRVLVGVVEPGLQCVERRDGRRLEPGLRSRRARHRHPPVGEVDRPADRPLRVAPDPDRRARPLHGSRAAPCCPTADQPRPTATTLSPVHARRIATIASSVRSLRASKSTPNAANSPSRYPAPTPMITRPPESASMRGHRLRRDERVAVGEDQQVGVQAQGRGGRGRRTTARRTGRARGGRRCRASRRPGSGAR